MSAPNKQQAQQYIAGLLVVVFALLLFRSFSHKAPPRAEVAVAPAAAKKETLLPGIMKKHYDDIDAKVLESTPGKPVAVAGGYGAHSLRDPFKNLLPSRQSAPVKTAGLKAGSAVGRAPIAERPPNPPALSLSGVWWADEPGALINGRVYHPGESIEGATVKEISREGVLLEFSGRPLLLTVSGYSGLGQAQEAKAAYGRR